MGMLDIMCLWVTRSFGAFRVIYSLQTGKRTMASAKSPGGGAAKVTATRAPTGAAPKVAAKTAPAGDAAKDKLTINLPNTWTRKLRQLAAERQENLNDVVLDSLKVYLFLSEERRRGGSIFVGQPGEPAHRELVFMDLPGAFVLAPGSSHSPSTEAKLAELAESIDEILAAMNTPEARAARDRALDATGEEIAAITHRRASRRVRQATEA